MHTNDTQFHLHIHEGATPEAVRAAVEAFNGRQTTTVLEDANTDVDLAAVGRRAYSESDGNMGPLMEYLADNADRWVSFAQASETLGFDTARSMPGLLGAFGRRANHRYGGQWPFLREQHNGEWQLFMPAGVAEAILELRDAGK